MYLIDKVKHLEIGVQGEHLATTLEFDMTSWVEQFPDAVFHLLFQPYNDPNVYPMVTVYDSDTNVLSWTVSNVATSVVGVGYTEIRAQDSDTGLVKKTRIIPTSVENSVSGEETDPPEPQEEWVTTVLNAKTAAESAAEDAEESATNAKKIIIVSEDEPENEPYNKLWIKDEADEEYQIPTYAEHEALEDRVEVLEPAATSGDVGKFLKAKTVEDGKVTEYEFGEASGGTSDYSDLTNKPQIGGVTLAGNKSLSDLGIAAASAIPDVSGKADKVSSPTSGNFAGLDGNGNLTDSGKKAADFVAAANFYASEMPMSSQDSTKVGTNVSNLLNAIDSNEHSIHGQSEDKNTFSKAELSAYENDFAINCDATGYSTVGVALAEDFCPVTDSETTDIFTKQSKNTITVDGTTTDEKYYYTRVDNNSKYNPRYTIKNGDTVNIAVYLDGSITGSGTRDNRLEVYLLDANNGQQYLWCDIANNGLNTATFTANRDVANIRVYLHLYAGYTFDNAKISWCGVIGSNGFSSATVVDNSVSYGKVQIGSNGFSIFPPAAHVEYMADLKEYIDSHVPSDMITESDLIYVSPEMYGAVGDGVADDSTALQDCIDDAISNKKVVQGFGRYKLSTGITIDGSGTDVFLNEIRYNGAGTAITLAGIRNRFRFNNIYAQNTGAKCIGIVNSNQENTDTTRLVIDGIALYADSYGISIDPTNNGLVSYIVARIKSINSASSDAIHTTGYPGEISIYDTYFACGNGWAFNGFCVNLFNCTIEGNCYGGVYANSCQINGGRVRELMDTLMPGNPRYGTTSGLIYKFKSISPTEYTGKIANVNIMIPDNIYYDTIDLSEFDNNVLPGSGNYTFYLGYIGVVNCPIIYGDANYANGYLVIGEKMLLHSGHKICKPSFPLVYTVETADFDMRDSAQNHLPYATVFNINVVNCVIKFPASYCAMGYNDIIISQTDSTKLATVYNNNGDLIFDGTDLGTGTYRLTAICDPTTDPDRWSTMVYNSGNMDVWTVEKLS